MIRVFGYMIVSGAVVLDPELTVNWNIDETEWEHGQVQGPSCRDWFWALLFLVQLAGMISLAILALKHLSSTNENARLLEVPAVDGNQRIQRDWLVVATGITIVGGIVALVAAFVLLLVGPLASMMIQVSLVSSPVASGLASIGALIMGQGHYAIVLGLSCLFGTWYAVRVWHRIPFATANLEVAVAAIRAYKGLLGVSYLSTALVVLWCAACGLAVTEVFGYHKDWAISCDDYDPDTDGDSCHLTPEGKWIVAGLALSFFWTSQVIRNVFHTTIAGVVGTFWFAPADVEVPTSPATTRGLWWWCCCCCSPTLYDAWIRASVYSLGSICLGSLLTATLQVLQVLVQLARNQRDDQQGRQPRQNSLLWCLLQFLVDQLERLIEYINSWAFVYVGLYGYDYLTSGSKVYNLFKARGLSLLLNDHLVARSLSMMQLFVGILAGALAVLLAFFMLGPDGGSHSSTVFGLGLVLGFLLASVQLQVVTSAVETVVVCFAEAPSALMENHSVEMASNMVRAWRRAYPTEFGV